MEQPPTALGTEHQWSRANKSLEKANIVLYSTGSCPSVDDSLYISGARFLANNLDDCCRDEPDTGQTP
jgi:hypothetical protein